MRYDRSGIGCSVIALNDLGNPMVPKMKRVWDTWDKRYYSEEIEGSHVDVYTKEGLASLVSYIKEMHPTGIVIFADNETANGNGSKFAKWLRKNNYRVDQSEQYVNENHRERGQSKKDSDKCVMYTWYWQRKLPTPKVASNERAGQKSVRSARGQTRSARSARGTSKLGSRSAVRKAA